MTASTDSFSAPASASSPVAPPSPDPRTWGQRLFIRRRHIQEAFIGPDPDAPSVRPLQPGQARLAIDSFSLTANNVTYAAFGEAMQYWQFFPSGQEGLGCLPVWGFATVCESGVEGVQVGRRVWGYWPAGTHLVVQPVRVGPAGFVDGAAHRQGLAAVYNQILFCDADPGWTPDGEGLQAVLRPLFMTAWLLDDFLAEQGFFGARQVLLSSASSKTAQATAHGLSQRRAQAGSPRVVGLTAPRHAGFVQGLGCHDEVVPYGELEGLDPAVPTLYVDFAGDAALRLRVHTHWGDRLMYSSSIGGTHWSELGSGKGLPGPRPVLFFAPAQAKARSAAPPEGWGAAELQRRMGLAWSGYIARVQAQQWMRIVRHRGAAQALQAYLDMVAGHADAQEGWMLDMHASPDAGG